MITDDLFWAKKRELFYFLLYFRNHFRLSFYVIYDYLQSVSNSFWRQIVDNIVPKGETRLTHRKLWCNFFRNRLFLFPLFPKYIQYLYFLIYILFKLLGASCRLPYVWYYLLCPHAKGQLISKANSKLFIWTKKPTKIFLYFCPSL